MLFLCLTSTNGHSFQTDAQVLDQLLVDIAEENTGALAKLYEKTSANVYSFALSILKNAQDAEDVLQDCFVNIYAAAGEYHSAGKPLAWILTITKNLCLKKLREQKKTAEDGLDQLDQLEAAFSEDDGIGTDFS